MPRGVYKTKRDRLFFIKRHPQGKGSKTWHFWKVVGTPYVLKMTRRYAGFWMERKELGWNNRARAIKIQREGQIRFNPILAEEYHSLKHLDIEFLY